MPIIDMLIDVASNHGILTFVDGYLGYSQIFVVESDIHKIAFRCPRVLGVYEWLVMPFGLKNARTTYQRAMNPIFHDLISKNMEVCINDVVVKSSDIDQHLINLE